MGSCCSKSSQSRVNDPRNKPYKVPDKEATKILSHVGRATYEVLKTKHPSHQQSLWNVTKSKMVGNLLQTPTGSTFWKSVEDPIEGHSNWFAEKMCDIMSKTTRWCDVMSLTAPDGYFLDQIKKALKNVCGKNEGSRVGKDTPIIVRFIFGNIIGRPVNCNKLIKELTKDLPEGANIQIWVGAWRTGQSWNHAKLIAVDGRYLHTGGHNLWTKVYLEEDPVHDVSLEMEGNVAHDAHLFANGEWQFIEKKQDTWAGQILEKVPDFLPLISKNRAIVSEYPEGKADEFAPYYNCSLVPTYAPQSSSVPIISVGRFGALTPKDRPADDAITAMIDSSRNIIRMSLQDLGPICLSGTHIPYPSTGWPKQFLEALARAIWIRGVDVEIVLSNIDSRDGYSNGWCCSDVGSEIIKRIESQFSNAEDTKIRQKVEENLRICYIKHAKNDHFKSGKGLGNHSKYFIVDDLCSYTGSQNLYVCDLAEWGVIVDDSAFTAKMLQDYWRPLWEASFVETDCDCQKVMDGLNIDREGDQVDLSTEDGRKKLHEAASALSKATIPIDTEMHYEEEDEFSSSKLF